MEIHNVVQGTLEWKALRKNYRTASDASAMMGVSPYKTRDQLLAQIVEGIEEEIDDFKQKLFDKGHETEAKARVILEVEIGEELYPVTGSKGNKLSSFDGITITEVVIFEHKMWNQNLVDEINMNGIPPSHYWQLEQQLDVAEAQKVRFVVSDGTKKNWAEFEYTAVKGRIEQLNAGWDQLEEDIKNYKPVVKIKKVEAVVIRELPLITYSMKGMELSSDLDVFKTAAKKLVADSEKELTSDQDFADAEKRNKIFKVAEDAIAHAQKQVLGEVASIQMHIADLTELKSLLSKARLASDKLVKSRKAEMKKAITDTAQATITEYLAECNLQFKGTAVSVPFPVMNFDAVMKGRSSINSIQSRINDEVAKLKVIIKAQANKYQFNLAEMKEHALLELSDNDIKAYIDKDSADVGALVKAYTQTRLDQQAAADQVEAEQSAQALNTAGQSNTAVVKKTKTAKPSKPKFKPLSMPVNQYLAMMTDMAAFFTAHDIDVEAAQEFEALLTVSYITKQK